MQPGGLCTCEVLHPGASSEPSGPPSPLQEAAAAAAALNGAQLGARRVRCELGRVCGSQEQAAAVAAERVPSLGVSLPLDLPGCDPCPRPEAAEDQAAQQRQRRRQTRRRQQQEDPGPAGHDVFVGGLPKSVSEEASGREEDPLLVRPENTGRECPHAGGWRRAACSRALEMELRNTPANRSCMLRTDAPAFAPARPRRSCGRHSRTLAPWPGSICPR